MEHIYIDRTNPQWKSNFHMHSTRSDGRNPIESVISSYRDAGYHVILPTDHNIMWNNEDYDTDTFLLMRGTEVNLPSSQRATTFPFNDVWRFAPHLLIIWDERRTEPCPVAHDVRIENDGSTGLTAWNRFAAKWREMGFYVVFCHPRWSKTTPELMLAMENFDGVEIYNHESELFASVGLADAEVDYALKFGKRFHLLAVDDSHRNLPAPGEAFRGGYTMIEAPVLERAAISRAMFEGRFYASEGGPTLIDMRVVDGVLHIECSAARAVRFPSDPHYAAQVHVDTSDEAEITRVELPLREGTAFVRPELIGFDGRRTWCPVVDVSALG